MNKANTPDTSLSVAWRQIDWRTAEKYVSKLQRRIYTAASQGNVKQVRKLQRTLRRSWYNRVLAIRRVTQDNRGKNTAGVDGVKSLSPAARMKLAKGLKLTGKSEPTRRVWIPKPGKDEKRPLGIPTMHDRALQGVLKAVLEPEWEAYFEPNSYGFRPGRGCHDAITQIKNCLVTKPKYVLDADISKCFDRINHEKLLGKLELQGGMRRQIKAWLKSGVIDVDAFVETKEGTPQGGVISPLLANVALHGMERMIEQRFPADTGRRIRNSKRKYGERLQVPNIVRYADDFVVMSDNPAVIKECKQYIKEWLSDIGLEIHPKKTRITHTLNRELSEDGKAGFDFLGFHVQQYTCSEKEGNEDSKEKRLGWKLLITPSKEKLNQHQTSLVEAIERTKGSNKPKKGNEKDKLSKQAQLINFLNPIVTGWMNYHKYSDIKTTGGTAKQDYLLYIKLRAWARRQCGTKTKGHEKYWMTIGKNNWVFATREEKGKPRYVLKTHSEVECSSTAYVKVKGTASPFDGNLVYWSTRMGEHPELNPRVAALLKRQRGKCTRCGLVFQEADVMEVDHVIPTAAGGLDKWDNLQLLHGHCHDAKSTLDLKVVEEWKRKNPNKGGSKRTTGKKTGKKDGKKVNGPVRAPNDPFNQSWIREDGVQMLGDLEVEVNRLGVVVVLANEANAKILEQRQNGTEVTRNRQNDETSLVADRDKSKQES